MLRSVVMFVHSVVLWPLPDHHRLHSGAVASGIALHSSVRRRHIGKLTGQSLDVSMQPALTAAGPPPAPCVIGRLLGCDRSRDQAAPSMDHNSDDRDLLAESDDVSGVAVEQSLDCKTVLPQHIPVRGQKEW